MKELSIEEKAKAYDELIERLKDLKFAYRFSPLSDTIEEIFPELTESEDDRIRKELLAFCKNRAEKYSNDPKYKNINAWIAWLEAQGEHANFRNKIQIGDKVTRNEDGVLVNLSQLKRVAKPAEKQGEQKSAENVELSAFRDKLIELFKRFEWYCKDKPQTNKDIIEYVDAHIQELIDTIQKPVDKVEPKFKVKYAGSEYNVLEVIDIAGVTFYGIEDEPNHIDYVLPNNCDIVSKQKLAEWSEEDDGFLSLLLAIFTNEHPNGIFTTDNITVFKGNFVTSKRIITWLISLRTRKQWKPSDEQINTLWDAIVYVEGCNSNFKGSGSVLENLYNDLKKLREE